MDDKTVTVSVLDFFSLTHHDGSKHQYKAEMTDARSLVATIVGWLETTRMGKDFPLKLIIDFEGIEFLQWSFVNEFYLRISKVRANFMAPEGIFSEVVISNLSPVLEELFEAVKCVREDIDKGVFKYRTDGHPFDNVRPKLYQVWRRNVTSYLHPALLSFLDSPEGQKSWDESPYLEYNL